ncbi:MAG: winged helix-turn-helix transcriptional regulator [Cyclobacteriaceae bacterium]|nr:winged helix-turn-helix transcriptional regulator [Cyclobacteriaceae bacterium]
MGSSKSLYFSEEQNRLAGLSKALSHPARIAILQYLVKNHTCMVGGLMESLPLSQSTISQHLKELRSIGIVRGEIEGSSVCYCIDEEKWKELTEALQGLIFDVNKTCCP